MDAGKFTALTWLDLSTAFDTIDYNILLKDLMIGLGLLGRHSTGLNHM